MIPPQQSLKSARFRSPLTWVSLADRLGGEEELVVRVGLDDASLAKRGGGVRGGSVGGLGGHLAALGLTETDGCKGVILLIDILEKDTLLALRQY